MVVCFGGEEGVGRRASMAIVGAVGGGRGLLGCWAAGTDWRIGPGGCWACGSRMEWLEWWVCWGRGKI